VCKGIPISTGAPVMVKHMKLTSHDARKYYI
jgi:hypothetical protein